MLFYKTFGSPRVKQTAPLLFLHGFLGSHLDWMPLIETLQNSYCCIAVDLPAHGNSPPSQDLFLELEKTLLSLCAPPPILIGYSLGGRLAFHYGKKHPEKIKGLMALSAHTGLKTPLERENRALQDLVWQERLKTLSPQEFLTLWYTSSVFSSLQKKPKLLEKLLDMRLYQNPLELSSILQQASLANQPVYDTFEYPVCFLYGEEDKSYTSLYSSKPPHLVRKIEKAGHVLHLENPLACIEAIQEFASL